MRPLSIAVLASIAVHAGLAGWTVSSLGGAPAKPRRVNVELADIKRVQEPPRPVEPPKPAAPPKKRLVKKVAQAQPMPRREEPKPELESAVEPPKVGLTADQTSTNGGIAVAEGVTLEGEIGTGTAEQKPVEAPTGTGRARAVPIYAVTKLPKPRRVVEPEIPAAFKSAAREIVVVVEVEIDTDGRVTAARLVKNVGFGLDEAALAAARSTEFEPALVGTEPVPVRYQIPYRIRVRG